MHRTKPIYLLLAAASLAASYPVRAATPADIVGVLAKAARDSDSRFAGFSARRGRQLLTEKPLAPVADAARFTDVAEAEKWFKRNCNDALGRDCTAQEKGDVLTYLISVSR